MTSNAKGPKAREDIFSGLFREALI